MSNAAASQLDVTIKETGVTVKGKSGSSDRTISHRDFLEGFSRLFNSENVDIESEAEVSKNPFLLPPNVYLFHPGKTYTEVGMFYRERQVPKLTYNGRDGKKTFKDFWLPNIVISVRLKTSSDPRNKSIAFALNDFRFFATDAGPLGLPNRLIMNPDNSGHVWVLPLPNMYSEGRMCTGGNSVISTYTKDLRPLHSLYRMIHESPFNNDLPIRSSSAHGDRSCKVWLEMLDGKFKEKPGFPYDLLSSFSPEKHKQNQAEFQYNATTME